MSDNSSNGINAQSRPAGDSGNNGFGGFGGASPFEGGASPFAPKQAPAQQQDNNPSGINNNPSPPPVRSNDNGVIPSARSTGGGANPLDKYMRSPDNGNNNGQQPQGQQQPAPAPKQEPPAKNFFDYTTDDYAGVYGKNDFVGESITPEIMTAIQQGDVNAFKQILNSAIANGASQSSFAVSQVAKAGVGQQFENFSSGKLKDILKDQSFEQNWQAVDSEILRHPQVEPMAKAKMNEFRSQYPEASKEEIIAATTAFFKDFVGAWTGNDKQQEREKNPPSGGLGSFFGR